MRLVCEKYTVTYDGDGSTGGAVPTDNNQYVCQTSVTVLNGTPTKPHYVFAGWLNSVDNHIYAAGESFTITANTTLTAQWTIDEYRIDSIPTSWRVAIVDGDTLVPTAYGSAHPDSGYVMIPEGAEFVIIPSDVQKPLVSKLELISGSISYATTAVNKTTNDAPFTNPLTLVGDGTVTYSMSGDNICSVNAAGLVTLNGTAGTCTITATVTDGPLYEYSPNTASYTLTVTAE